MKKSVFKSVLFAATTLFITSSVQAAEDRVIASVNGTPILESQVRKSMGKKADYKATLEKIIDDMLVQKAIQESNVKVNYAQLNNMVEVIAAQNGLTYGQFLDALDYQGISLNAFRQQLANQMLMSAVRDQAISQSVEITREQIEQLSNKLLADDKSSGAEKKITGQQYEVRHILLKLSPVLNDAQAKSQLNQIRSDIQSGKISFADAALKYSKDYLSGANGGSLGYAFAESYVGPFAQTVKSSKTGIISEPFKTEFGWHILEVTGIKDADRTEEAYRQKAYDKLVNQQLQEAAKDWVKVLRKAAEIKYY
ncbi:peptidylprolyl isomerase [Rodentibacter caecimuris]|uniref:Peptidylprolyl isomerase n=1 Tax=Rodentibacter caecimuris TaxID=1796644 RepID=A0ABX3KYF7_9PAST|nr:peptidylprolyl isomerase [Rodentibacter heylii]